jgi:hypothetical protein
MEILCQDKLKEIENKQVIRLKAEGYQSASSALI